MGLDRYLEIARHAGLAQPEPLLAALGALSLDPREVAETLRIQHLVPLIRALVPAEARKGSLPAALADALSDPRPAQKVSYGELLRSFAEAQTALSGGGVPVLLLKGFYFGERFYGGPERRPQYDLDLLVRPSDFRRAIRLLAGLGFRRKSTDLHSRTLVRGVVQVDLHRYVRRSPVYTVDGPGAWRRAVEARVGDVAFQTLCDEDYVTLLSVSLFEDLGFGKGKLKQLLDLYLLLREIDGVMDWERYFAARAGENLAGVTANTLAFVHETLAEPGELPSLAAALERRQGLLALKTREENLQLLSRPRGAADNTLWFGRVYPGSVLVYRASFWWRTFPGNLRNIDAGWWRRNLRLVRHGWSGRGGS